MVRQYSSKFPAGDRRLIKLHDVSMIIIFAAQPPIGTICEPAKSSVRGRATKPGMNLSKKGIGTG